MKKQSTMFKKLLALTLSVLMMASAFATVIGSFLPAAAADAANAKVVQLSSPAIKANVGEAVDLSSYTIQFSEEKMLKGSDVTFTSSVLTIADKKVTPDKKGVFAINAVSGELSTKIYLVVKNANETEYVLYEENYDSYANGTTWEEIGYRKFAMTSGASCTVQNGKLFLDASGGDYYVRVYFPDYLDAFQYYTAEYVGAILDWEKSGRWMALVSRAQPAGYPYYQFAVRTNATADNGVEFAFRNESNKFVVPYKGPYAKDMTDKAYRTFKLESAGEYVKCSIDGTTVIEANDVTNYLSGSIGFHVRGADMSVDSVKIVLGDPPATESKPIIKGDVATVLDPASNIALPASIITPVKSEAELKALTEKIAKVKGGTAGTVPATAIFEVTNKTVLGGKTYAEAVAPLDLSVIPAFYVKDLESAKDVATWLRNTGFDIDSFIISDNAECLKAARAIAVNIRAVLDFSGKAANEINVKEVRTATNAAGARICILPESVANNANVEYLQRLFMTVWTKNENATKVSLATDITTGTNGIITSDYELLGSMYTEFFVKSTIVRPSAIIGHRGVPSLAQENSLAGAIKAYELGATAVENDIYLSKDGVIVVMHDSTIDRTTTGVGKVTDLTYAELQKYQIDLTAKLPTEPIPTLEDYFKEFKGKDVQIVVEIKQNSTAICAPLKAMIEKYDILDQVNVISFHTACLVELKKILPEVSVGYLTSTLAGNEKDPVSAVKVATRFVQTYNSTYNPNFSNGALGPKFAQAAAHRGVTIWPYTIDGKGYANRYFLECISGITTNYSQFYTDCLRSVKVAESEYVIENLAGLEEIKVLGKTYGRVESELKKAQLVVLDGDNVFTLDENGIITASAAGTATVMIGVEGKSLTGSIYTMYTNPFKITLKTLGTNSETEPTTDPTTEPTTDPSTTPGGVVDTVPATGPANTTPQPAQKKSCGSFSFAWFAIISLASLAAVVIIKKK